MTGEKDPRDVMQAEHDARLSEHPAFRAPAEVPGVEEIARLIDPEAWDIYLPHMDRAGAQEKACRKARAVFDLFAPILAEKERDNRQLRLEVAEERETSRISIYGWRDKANEMEARALAAESALAAERERKTVAMARLKEYASDPDIALTLQGSPDKCQALQDAIAAAIRAQGE